MASLEEQKRKLQELRKEYKALTNTEPPKFDIKNLDDANSAVKAMNVSLREAKREALDITNTFADLQKQIKGILGELKGQENLSKSITKEFQKQENIVTKLKYDQEGLDQLNLKELQALKKKQQISSNIIKEKGKELTNSKSLNGLSDNAFELEVKRLKAKEQLTDEEEALIRGAREGFSITKEINDEIDKRIKKEEQVQKNLGLTGGALKSIGGILDKMGLGGLSKSLGIEDATKEAEKFSRELETDKATKGLSGFQKKSMVMGKAFSEMGKNLMKSLTDPLTILLTIGKAALDNNKKIVDFQRVMGLSRKEAKGLKSELVAAARASDDMNVTTKALAHTLMSVQEQFGFTADFSTETLETATKLTKTVKLSEEAANSLAVASTLSSVAFEEQYQNALLASREIQIQEGRSYSLRAILEDVGKVTGSTRAQLGGSVVEITKAITQAKAFGASLEDVASAGRALLDFEDSITKELEAELLLGKDINLERARSAALMGDQATVAKELAREAGTFEEFGKMNVLQQEALAEAMGMTSDQLADILFQQEIEGKNAQELRALGKEELANRLEQQNAQEAFNASVEQLKGLFTDVMGFLEPILSGFTSLVGLIMEFKEAFMIVSGLQLIYIARKKLILALEARDIALKGLSFGKSLGFLVVDAVTQAAKVHIVGPALAVAAGAAIYSAFKGYEKKGDDVLSPGSNRSGYGNRVLFGPEGAISLNNKDTIIAGTNLRRGDDVMSGPPGSMSIGDGEAKKTNDLLRKVLNRPAPQPTIVMNDQELGTAINMGAFSIQ